MNGVLLPSCASAARCDPHGGVRALSAGARIHTHSTAVVNAYLAPVMRRYVKAVDAYFRALGPGSRYAIFQSNGGLAIGQAMTDRSVYAINSGSASAPQAVLFVCVPFQEAECHHVDMGGTSFDITLTKDADQPQQEHRLPALSHRRADDPGGNTGGRGRDPLAGLIHWPHSGWPAIWRAPNRAGLLWARWHRTTHL